MGAQPTDEQGTRAHTTRGTGLLVQRACRETQGHKANHRIGPILIAPAPGRPEPPTPALPAVKRAHELGFLAGRRAAAEESPHKNQ